MSQNIDEIEANSKNITNCQSCGKPEIYTWLDVENSDNVLSNGYLEYRRCYVCEECCEKLEPDMWISKRCWESIKPLVSFENLPLLEEDENENNI